MPTPNADSDLRDFYFYFKYLWAPADFENLQKWLRSATEGLGEGAYGGASLSGLTPLPGGGLNVQVESGIGVNSKGRLLVLPSTGSVAVASPSGNPAWSLVILRPTETNTNMIPEPQNPSNSVPLHKAFGATLMVLNGTPSPSPSYPATQSGDLVLIGVKLASGQLIIAQSDFDRNPVTARRQLACPIQINTDSVNLVDENAEHVEGDCSSGAQTHVLPSAAAVPGKKFTFVKTDSSSNVMSVSGTDGISGQNSHDLEDQWQTLTVRSNGLAYRII